jgi:hypothetical protein
LLATLYIPKKKLMADHSESEKKKLEQKILSKRQQIEFEKTNIDLTSEFSEENRENPDVMEEAKNFDDPPENVIEKNDARSLQKAEQELSELIEKLSRYNRD